MSSDPMTVSKRITNGVERILEELAKEPCTPKQLIERTGLAGRTVSFHLRLLLQQDPPVISKRWNLEDVRQPVYAIIESSCSAKI